MEFYVSILGFEILYERTTEHFAYLRKNNAEIMLEQIGVGRNFVTGEMVFPLGRGINFQIEVEDVEALCNSLLQHQAPIFLPMEEKWYQKKEIEVGNRQFCVQDPDGYLLRFYKDLGTRKI